MSCWSWGLRTLLVLERPLALWKVVLIATMAAVVAGVVAMRALGEGLVLLDVTSVDAVDRRRHRRRGQWCSSNWPVVSLAPWRGHPRVGSLIILCGRRCVWRDSNVMGEPGPTGRTS